MEKGAEGVRKRGQEGVKWGGRKQEGTARGEVGGKGKNGENRKRGEVEGEEPVISYLRNVYDIKETCHFHDYL